MKKLLAIVVAVIFVLGLASFGFAAEAKLKCDGCHKGEKAIGKIVEKNKITTAADLTKALKEGPKKDKHKSLKDEDIKAAADSLKLK